MCTFIAGGLLHYLFGELSHLIGGTANKPWFWYSKEGNSITARTARMKMLNKTTQFKSILENTGLFGLRDAVSNCPYFIMTTGWSGGLTGEGNFECLFMFLFA